MFRLKDESLEFDRPMRFEKDSVENHAELERNDISIEQQH